MQTAEAAQGNVYFVKVLLVSCLLVLSLLSGCATPPQSRNLIHHPPSDIPKARLLHNTPFFPQKAYQCGPAALAMLLSDSGIEISPDDLVSQVYVPAKEGTFQVEVLAATRKYNRLALEIEPNLSSLFNWVDKGEPVLVLQNLGLDWYQKWHYAVVIGYDLEAMEVILHSGEIAYYRVSIPTFERTWQRAHFWGITALTPGELPYKEDPRRYFQAAAALEETNSEVDMQSVWQTGAIAWPQAPELTFGLANYQYKMGEIESAMTLYKSLVERFPDFIPAYNNLATLQTESGQLDTAIETAKVGLEKAGGKNPILEDTLATAQKKKMASRR